MKQKEKKKENMNPIDAILARDFSEGFAQLMRNRIATSSAKYGPLHDNYPRRVDAMSSAILRVNKYKATRNLEYLVDAANFLMIEFLYPSLEGAYFAATDSDQSPGLVYREGIEGLKGELMHRRIAEGRKGGGERR